MCEEGRERVPPSWMSPGVRRRGCAWPRAWRQGPVLSPVSLSLVFSPQSAAVALQGCCVVAWEGRGDAGRGILRVPTTEQPVLSQHAVRKEGDPTTGPVSPCGP